MRARRHDDATGCAAPAEVEWPADDADDPQGEGGPRGLRVTGDRGELLGGERVDAHRVADSDVQLGGEMLADVELVDAPRFASFDESRPVDHAPERAVDRAGGRQERVRQAEVALSGEHDRELADGADANDVLRVTEPRDLRRCGQADADLDVRRPAHSVEAFE